MRPLVSMLFPVFFVFRKLKNVAGRLRASHRPSGVVALPGLLNNVLVRLLAFEALLLPKLSLPFAVSPICIVGKEKRRPGHPGIPDL